MNCFSLHTVPEPTINSGTEFMIFVMLSIAASVLSVTSKTDIPPDRRVSARGLACSTFSIATTGIIECPSRMLVRPYYLV